MEKLGISKNVMVGKNTVIYPKQLLCLRFFRYQVTLNASLTACFDDCYKLLPAVGQNYAGGKTDSDTAF